MNNQYAIMLLEGKEKQPSIYRSTFICEDSAYKKAHELCDNAEDNDFAVYEVQQPKSDLCDYVTYCKDHAIDHLSEMRGWNNEVYMCDLGNELTIGINVDGSATYSTYEAKRYLKEWWEEVSEVYEYQKDNYGKVLHNPFENPEAFHVCMIIEGVNYLMSQCPTVDKYWNEKKKMTTALLNKIIKEVELVDEIKF